MRILFFALHWGYLRHYDAALRKFAENGHELILVAEKQDKIGSSALIEELAATYPQIRHEFAPDRRRDPWLYVGNWIRLGLDYLRYLRPEYSKFPKLWRRSRARTPRSVVWLAELPGMRSGRGLKRLGTVLRCLEHLIPANLKIECFIRERRPDAILITPLLGLGTSQYDDLQTAKRLGLKTVLCVGSWDHLSSKALVRFAPDLVTLWNGTQKHEAMAMHGIPEERIAVTGAQGWDRWFDRRPSRDRDAFCRDVGLDPTKPFVLWLCSTPFPGSPPEADLVHRWIRSLRSSADARIRDVGILCRPHPQRMAEWGEVDLSGYANLSLWGANPVTENSRDDYFDSMYHCAAAVGLNTSAMIEAGILGKSVHTILAPEFHDSQIETIHFHYMREVAGGLLHEAGSIEENIDQLAQTLGRKSAADPKSQRFTRAFVRPHGLEQPATPLFVSAVEDLLASDEPIAREEPVGSPALRLALRPILGLLYITVGLFRATPLGMRVHRGKKLVRAGFLRLGGAGRRAVGHLRKAGKYRIKGARLFVYRTNKSIRLSMHRLGKKRRAGLRFLALQAHRAKKQLVAGQRLLFGWLRPGG